MAMLINDNFVTFANNNNHSIQIRGTFFHNSIPNIDRLQFARVQFRAIHLPIQQKLRLSFRLIPLPRIHLPQKLHMDQQHQQRPQFHIPTHTHKIRRFDRKLTRK